MVPSFFFLENDQIFYEKVAKSCFRNCPLFRKLRDYCYSLLLLTLVNFFEVESLSLIITHQNVPILHKSFPNFEEGLFFVENWPF